MSDSAARNPWHRPVALTMWIRQIPGRPVPTSHLPVWSGFTYHVPGPCKL